MKVDLCDIHVMYMCVCVPLLTFIAESVFMKLGMYIMALGHISTAYFKNPSHQFVGPYVCPPIAATQRLGKAVTAITN
jgi:hypothetical protein